MIIVAIAIFLIMGICAVALLGLAFLLEAWYGHES